MSSNRKLISYIVLASVMLVSCEKDKTSATILYPVDSLIQAQIDYLSVEEVRLQKEATINGVTDTISITPSKNDWADELDIFRQLSELNKPIYTDVYTIESETPDPKSNLKIMSFNSIKPVPVVYMNVYYQDKPWKVRKIEAVYNEKNLLYSSKRQLKMEFQNLNNTTILTSYSVTGGQKMVLSDSVEFSIKGKLVYH